MAKVIESSVRMAKVTESRAKPEWCSRIDRIPPSERMKRMRERYFNETPRGCGERLRLAVEAWKENEGEHIELRRAKMLKKILEGIPVVIHDDELTVGSQTRFFRGAYPYIDWDAEYFKDGVGVTRKQGEGANVTFASPELHGPMSEEDWRACLDAAAYFKGTTAAEIIRDAAKTLWGSWYEDAKEVWAAFPADTLPFPPGVTLFERLVEKGLGSIIREAKAGIQRFAAMGENDVEKLYFWQAVIIACEAVISFARRYAQLAREMALKEKDAARKQELEEIAKICEWVPENPARTFHEAIQSVRLTHLALLWENSRHGPSLGRVDQYLYPYFKRDVEDGRLTLERAAELIADFVSYLARLEAVLQIRLKDAAQTTMITNLTLGGVTRQGEDATNELTYLFTHVAGLARYAEPHFTLRCYPKITPHWLVTKGLEVNRKTPGIPMYTNDQHVTECMVSWGVPLEEARDYSINSCSQPVVLPARYYMPWLFNAPVALELALNNGVSRVTGKRIGLATGDPRSFKTFDEVYEAWKKQYEFILRRLMHLQHLFHRAQLRAWRTPLNSALQDGCVESGKNLFDFVKGGRHLTWLQVDRGLVDVGDCLTAIKKLVFEDKRLTMAELVGALDSNFQGERREEIRQMCERAPKYGNEIDDADYMVRDVAKFSAKLIRSENNVHGQKYVITRPGASWHYGAGKLLGALPNGRKAGEPLCDGSLSPMRGMDKQGVTAVLNSALKADYKEAAVAVLNLKFPLALVQSPEALEKVAALTEGFLGAGGSHVQYNFLDKQVLLDAKKHPEMYKDLIVRVAGYSAYFVNLTPEIQDDIIARTEHEL